MSSRHGLFKFLWDEYYNGLTVGKTYSGMVSPNNRKVKVMNDYGVIKEYSITRFEEVKQ